jgi:uncharacterized protein YjbI with pentapeptide repeats
MDNKELSELLDEHRKWLQDGAGTRLRKLYAELHHGNLAGLDLRFSKLAYVKMRFANLSDTIMIGADLSHADLYGVTLRRANLRSACLQFADLRYANFEYADLEGAKLGGAVIMETRFPKGFRVSSLTIGGWTVTATPTATTIGQLEQPNDFWLSATTSTLMDSSPCHTIWWRKHHAAVREVIRDVMQD